MGWMLQVKEKMQIKTTIRKFKEFDGKMFNATSDKSKIYYLSHLFQVPVNEIKKYISQKRLTLVSCGYVPY